MKVLEEGKWEKEFWCRECHSKLLVIETDIKYGSFKGRDHRPECGFFYICANCGSHCQLFGLPPLIAERVRKKFAKPKEVKRGHHKSQK